MQEHVRRVATEMRYRLTSENGATMVEYALLLALVAMAVLGAAQFFADEHVDVWEKIGSSVH